MNKLCTFCWYFNSTQSETTPMDTLPFNHVWTLFFYGQLWVNLYRVVFFLQIYDSGLEVTRQYTCLLQGTLQTTRSKQYYSKLSLNSVT